MCLYIYTLACAGYGDAGTYPPRSDLFIDPEVTSLLTSFWTPFMYPKVHHYWVHYWSHLLTCFGHIIDTMCVIPSRCLWTHTMNPWVHRKHGVFVSWCIYVPKHDLLLDPIYVPQSTPLLGPFMTSFMTSFMYWKWVNYVLIIGIGKTLSPR